MCKAPSSSLSIEANPSTWVLDILLAVDDALAIVILMEI